MRLRSIEHKIFLLILPICIIPPVLLMLLLGVGSRMTFEQTIGSELYSRAEYLSGAFDQFFSVKIERLRALMEHPPADLNQLTSASAAAAGVSGVALVRAARPTETTVTLTVPDDKVAYWIAEAGYFKPFTQGKLRVPLAGCFQDIQIAIPSRVAPLPLLMFVMQTPARDRIFFLFETEELIKAFRQSLPQHPENFYVHSSSGFVPYDFEAADPLLASHIVGKMGEERAEKRWFEMRDSNKPYLVAPAASKYLTHAQSYDGQSVIWSILLTYDMDNFLSPLEAYIWLSVLIALALVVVTLLLGMVAGRNIVRPLLDLKRQAEEISKGRLEARAAVQSHDEIGELADTFNTMAARLHETHHELMDRLEDNQLRIRHINVINEITAAVVQALSLDRIFEALVREMGKLVRCDAIWIALFDAEGRKLSIRCIHPAPLAAHFGPEGRIPLSGSIHGHAVESHETIHAEIGHHDRGEFFETRALRAEGFQSYLIAPLPARDRIIGTLTVAATAPDALGGSMAPILGSLAGAVAIAIEQSELFQRISNFAAELEQKVEDRTRELAQIHQKLVQTEKYFATGRLAGNLAHEINNPLAIIKNHLRLVQNALNAAEGAGMAVGVDRAHLQVINEEVDRIARLVHQMLNLHRPEEQALEPIDVNETLGELLARMSGELEERGIRIERELGAGLPRLLGSPDLIRQMLHNLLRNARDAMARGGTLMVRTAALAQAEGGAEQESLRVQIADDGCGIAPEHLTRIFDPFFTTKPPEQGTGLGLCVSYSIVTMHHGTIDVASQAEQGTTVTVTLPVGARAMAD